MENVDLISREGLLERIEKERAYLKARGLYGAEEILTKYLRNIVEDMPSAEIDSPVIKINIPEEEVRKLLEELQKPQKVLVLPEPEVESVRPQGDWIPVSERLPERRDWYLGVFREPDTDFIGIPYICDYVGKVTKGTTNEGWILRHCTDVDNASDYFRNLICVAWKPLPKPYEKGGAK